MLDRPALVADGMDAVLDVTTGNDPVLVFGDFDSYVIADRIGSVVVEPVPHLPGANRRPSGQRGWLAHVRHGAGVVNTAAFRLLVA